MIRLGTAIAIAVALSASPANAEQAQYEVTIGRDPRVLMVTARIPARGGVLTMAPWGYPPAVQRGWAAFIEKLEVRSGGRRLEAVPAAPAAWKVDAPDGTTLDLVYLVRLTHDQHDWDPAGGVDARPAVLDSAVVWMTKAFIIAPPIEALGATVQFRVPSGDRVSTPWEPVGQGEATFRTTSLDELYNNTVVIGRHIHRELSAGDLRVVLAIDPAMAAQDAGVTDLLSRAIAAYGEIVGGPVRSRYLVALRRDVVDDGEAFTSSFVQVFRHEPVPSRAVVWGNTLVHELFHVSTRQLVPADQSTVEWFNEGFTEYMASRTLVRLGAISPAEWRQKLGFYLSRAEATRIWDRERPTLAAAGADKMRNWRWIYGGGAALAAHLDILLRAESAGRVSLDDVFRLMHRRFGMTGRPFTGADVVAAVTEVSGRDWSAFFATYIDGPAPSLPLPDALERIGLATSQFGDEFYLVPVATPTPAQRALHRAVTGH
jgi:predicted metalloprotease with PDZ domain